MQCAVPNCPNEAEPNQRFCKPHQIEYVVLSIDRLHQHLHKIDATDPNFTSLEQEMRSLISKCNELPGCMARLRELAINLQLYLSPDGVVDDPLQHATLEATADLLSATQQGIDPIIDSYRVNEQQASNNDAKIAELQTQLQSLSQNLQSQQQQTQDAMSKLQQTIEDTKRERESYKRTEQELLASLANAKGQSVTATGMYVEQNAKLQQDLQIAQQQLSTLQRRELQLDQELRDWQESELELNAKVRDLHESYEQKIRDLQDDYAMKINRGEKVLSMREQQMARELQQMERLVAKSIEEQELANKKTEQAKNFLQTTECGNLAQELLNVNERMKVLQDNVNILQRERDAMVADRARLEVSLGNRLREGQQQLATKLDQANKTIQIKNQEIMAHNQEIVNLNDKLQAIKQDARGMLSTQQMQLTQLQFELRQRQEQERTLLTRLSEEKKMLEDEARNRKLQLDMEFQNREDDLHRRFQQAEQQLQTQRADIESKLQSQKRELQSNQKRLQTQEEILNQRTTKLNTEQAQYEAQMFQFRQQQDELNAALAQSKQRGDQLMIAEQNFRTQLDQIRRTAAVDREEFVRKEEELKSQLSKLREAHSAIQYNLNECSTARDSLLLKFEQQKREMDQMQVQYAKLKTQEQNYRSQATLTIDKLRADVNKMRNTVADAAQQLEQIPAIHQHNLDLQEKMKHYQQQTEQYAVELASTKTNIEKVMNERSLASQRIHELQKALQACNASKQFLETSNYDVNERLRELKLVNQELTHVAERNAHQFQNLIEEQDYNLTREREKEVRNKIMAEQKLETEKRLSKEKTAKLLSLAKQNQYMAQSMADTALTNAQSIQSMVPLPKRDPLPQGRSSLFEE